MPFPVVLVMRIGGQQLEMHHVGSPGMLHASMELVLGMGTGCHS